MNIRDKYRQGFSMVELAIVLVIVGLLTGGILAGQTLIRSAQIRSMLGESDSYIKAIKEFQDKYLALPGDMNNAEAQWGSDVGCPATGYNNVPKKETCNGDGLGTIGTSDTAGVISNSQEWFRAWQQLADAGFVPGSFTGVQGPASVLDAVPGLNVPASKLDSAGWTLMYFLLTSNSWLWGDQYGHMLVMGGHTAGTFTRDPVLMADEALSIDSKIDDGKPGTGKVRAWRTAVLPNCTASDTAQDVQIYNTGSDVRSCSLIFLLGY